MRSYRLPLVFLGLAGLGIAISSCGNPPQHQGVVVSSATDCASCHQSNYNATTAPAHASIGYPTTCGDCHDTISWNVTQHMPQTEAKFPIGSGVHGNPVIACTDCHDTTVSQDFRNNANCTKTCHTAANTEGFNTNNPNLPDFVGHHNGATWNGTDKQFCRQCHPTGMGVAQSAMVHKPTQDCAGHEGSSCNECHNASLSPPTPNNQPDFSQDIQCNSHHHNNQDEGTSCQGN